MTLEDVQEPYIRDNMSENEIIDAKFLDFGVKLAGNMFAFDSKDKLPSNSGGTPKFGQKAGKYLPLIPIKEES